MGFFDDELILPGTITEIVSDYSYGYDTSSFGTTDSVTILGTAFNGPVGKPVEIYSPEHAKYIFGGTYDSKSRKEATLVAEIIDTWNRGCRTIYAVRVSGKPIFKDFQLAIDTNLKLRVAGIFPSEKNKDTYMVFDNTEGSLKLKIYKPAERATIQEKMQGMVEREDSILITTFDLSSSYGYTKDTSLVDLIKTVNQHLQNNVIRLSIVDENGVDATQTSSDAKVLALGVMFPGAYFIGRDKNNGYAATDLEFSIASATNKPYASFDGMVFKTLETNTDINKELPIFGERTLLNKKFVTTGNVPIVSMGTMWDFLEVPGKVDLIFGKDSIDYEEVELSDFDLYQRLGSGFALTAQVVAKGGTDVAVKPTPVSDTNRVIPIQDGIYSMLENLKSDYRLLANATADASIKGKLPKKADFRVAVPIENTIFGGKIIANAVVDKKDVTAPKQFKFTLGAMTTPVTEKEVTDGLFTAQVVKRVSAVEDITDLAGKVFKNGELFYDETTHVLSRFYNGAFIALTDANIDADMKDKLFLAGDVLLKGTKALVTSPVTYVPVVSLATEFGAKPFVIVESSSTVAVYKVATNTLVPVGALHQIFSDVEDKTFIVVESESEVENTITITSDALDIHTLDDFVTLLNEDQDLKRFFTFKVALESEKDEYLEDLLAAMTVVQAAVTDKEQKPDMNMYIPYTTIDNFARHLAQHCTYASLKTAPTHGVMGCSKIMDVSLNAIASKVNVLTALDLNMHAKRPNGADMLDSNNLPYHIGRNISVVVSQYVLDNTLDGYSYVSNGAAGYAGMISALPLDQSSTNQPINIPVPMFDFTTYQLGKLTQKGFITMKQSYTKGYVVTDGITMALVDSSFRRLSITRIINAVEEVIRTAVEPFIGKQNHLTNRNSMQTAIKSSIDKLKGKLIEGHDFKLTVDPSNLKLGIVNIDYTIVPIYEIREVRNRITVKES